MRKIKEKKEIEKRKEGGLLSNIRGRMKNLNRKNDQEKHKENTIHTTKTSDMVYFDA